ncbi:MAG: hypothetical protein WC729_05515 [Sphingomonas sp.]|uniref:hypothetical protein n=1 Tax=Sphingomonas sp. TaxID=28214 RepID=UPI0035646075
MSEGEATGPVNFRATAIRVASFIFWVPVGHNDGTCNNPSILDYSILILQIELCFTDARVISASAAARGLLNVSPL